MDTKETKTTVADKSAKKTTTPETSAQTQNQQKPSETAKDGQLYKFFIAQLKDIYFAEKQILETLPKLRSAATTEELQEAFEDHYLQTQKHVTRLEKVFGIIGEKPEAVKCDAIVGILKEGDGILKETEEGSMTRDAALIIAAQKVEHYEIATYGGLVALAETLGFGKAGDILHVTLEEEEDTDHDLTDIAERFVNFDASEEDDDDDDIWDEYSEEYDAEEWEESGE